jgi:NAD-dependent deacetylase
MSFHSTVSRDGYRAAMSLDGPELAAARRWLLDAQRIVVLTGAGISTDSGIPDFRGPQGVWTKNPEAERLATIDVYMSEPDARKRAWQNRVASPAWDARPNAGHLALVDLERRGNLLLLVTQNIDGLHQQAGSDPANVVEIHGTIRRVKCMACRRQWPSEEILARVRAGEEDPPCSVCGGILKSATISFGENLVPEDLLRAERAALAADLVLAVGSSLSVYPAAGVVPLAKRAGARVVIVNGEPTALDDLADAVLLGPISEILPALCRN